MKSLKVMRWLMLISGILLVILGITMLFTPVENLVALVLFIGISMLISSISEIVSYFQTDKEDRSGWVLAEGIIVGLLSIWMLFGSGTSALTVAIPYIFAAWVMISGIMRSIASFDLKSNGSHQWGWLLAMGILGIILGLLLMFTPLLSATIVATVIAILVISAGFSNIAMFFSMKRLRDFIRRRRGDKD